MRIFVLEEKMFGLIGAYSTKEKICIPEIVDYERMSDTEEMFETVDGVFYLSGSYFNPFTLDSRK